MPETFDFGGALDVLRNGSKVARLGWNGKGMWLLLVDQKCAGYSVSDDDVDDLRLLPWIGMKTADDGFVPWLASQTDVLATDWCVA